MILTRRFPLGQTLATPGVLAALQAAGESGCDFLARHAKGDWGCVDADDWKANDDGLETADRLVSAYKLKDGTKIWIITDADRSATTMLLPDEY